MKIIILIILIVAGWYVYNNVDFNQLLNQTTNTIKNEKTIQTVNGTRENIEQKRQEALNY